MSIQETINIIMPALSFVGVIFLVYNKFTGPDIKADKEIFSLNERCVLKHEYLNKDLEGVHSDIHDIKINHLDHIERDISEIKQTQMKILTILQERDFKK